MKIAEAFVELRSDDRVAKAEVQKQAKGLGSQFAQIFGAAAFGAGLKKSIDAASDLNETVSKTRVVFGGASGEIEKFAATAATSMGMSKKAYLDAASGLKGLLTNLGLADDQSTKYAQSLTGLGADLASFFNTDPADAIDAISSALRGEVEPIRKYNVNINDAAVKTKAFEMGLYSGKGAIDANAKAQATLALITDQTASAQGDFARTADGVANSQRIAKAEAENAAASLGQNFLPIYQRVVEVVGFLAEKFGELPGPVQVGVVALAGMVALAGPLGSLVEVGKSVAEAISKIGTTSLTTLGAVGLLIGAGLLLYSALSDTNDLQAQTAARSKEAAAALGAEVDKIVGVGQAALDAAPGVSTLADAQVALSNALTAGDKGKDLADNLGKLGLQGEDAARVLSLIAAASESVDGAFTASAIAAQGQIRALLEANGASTEVAATLEAITYQGYDAGGMWDVTKDKVKKWTAEQQAAAKAAEALGIAASTTDIAQISSDFLNGEVATSKYREGLVAAAEAQVGASRNGERANDVFTAYIGILEGLNPEQKKLYEATTETDKATKALTVTTHRQKSASDDLTGATEETRGKFEEAATAADDLKKAIDAVFSPYMDLEEANRNIQQGLADVTQSLKDNGTTLDINTDKGRANRQAIEDQVKGILDFSVALVNQGASEQDAANATAMLTQQLHDQLKAAGLTEDQIASYLDTLGLTPANVRTTIELAEADKRKRELGDLLGQLGDIDAGAKAEIQANIDQGKFDEANAKITALAKDRGIALKVSLTGGGTVDIGTIGSKIYVKAHAQGAYIGAPELATLGEGGRPEAVLPLTNRRRMAALLGDPRIGRPVMDALGSAAAGGVAVASSTVNHYHSHTWQIWGTERSYVADLMRKFEILASGG